MNTFKPTIQAIVLFCCAVLLSNATAQVADARFPKAPYRAEAVVTSEGVSTPMVIYASGRKMRIEMDAGDADAVQIIDFDTNEAFMLTRANGQSIATKISTNNIIEQMGLNNTDRGAATGRKKIVQTACQTYAMKGATVCVSKDNITLESIAPNATMRVTKLNMGSQNAGLFKMPAGYKVIDLSAMVGVNAGSFSSSNNTMKNRMSDAGLEDSSGSLLEGINAIIDAEDDDASGQAAMDALMGQMGFDPGTLTTKDTTAGVLAGVIDNDLDMSDDDKAKGAALMKENERMMKIIENDGMSGLLRDAGLSETEITNMEKSQAEFGQKMQAHADKHKDQINHVDASGLPSDAKAPGLEAELDAMNARAEALAADGDISESDKEQVQNEALQMLEAIFGELPKN